jgi:hypothetical protein
MMSVNAILLQLNVIVFALATFQRRAGQVCVFTRIRRRMVPEGILVVNYDWINRWIHVNNKEANSQ